MVKLHQSIKYLLSRLALAFFISLIWSNAVLAHCPLCTIGAGAAVGIAIWLGVSLVSVGIFIGAFSIAVGLWIARLIPKKFRFKFSGIALLSFIMTIWPITPLVQGYYPIFINLSGDYGSILNRTYLISQFLVGALIGAILMFIAPSFSCKLKKFRQGKTFKFQTIAITFLLLIITALIFEIF